MDLKKIIKLAEAAEAEVAELTSGLVKFNSAHPDGYTDECVEYIKAYCDKHGIENEVHANNPKKPKQQYQERNEVQCVALEWSGNS